MGQKEQGDTGADNFQHISFLTTGSETPHFPQPLTVGMQGKKFSEFFHFQSKQVKNRILDKYKCHGKNFFSKHLPEQLLIDLDGF